MIDKLKGIVVCVTVGALFSFVAFWMVGVYPDRSWKVVFIVSSCQAFAFYVMMWVFDRAKITEH